MCIGSRCYTSDHVVTAFQREEYFGRSRVCGYRRLKIGGSVIILEIDFHQRQANPDSRGPDLYGFESRRPHHL